MRSNGFSITSSEILKTNESCRWYQPGEKGGRVGRRLDDVIRDTLVEIAQNFNQRASDAGGVGGRKGLVQRHHVVRIRDSLFSIAAAITAAAAAAAMDKAAESRSPLAHCRQYEPPIPLAIIIDVIAPELRPTLREEDAAASQLQCHFSKSQSQSRLMPTAYYLFALPTTVIHYTYQPLFKTTSYFSFPLLVGLYHYNF